MAMAAAHVVRLLLLFLLCSRVVVGLDTGCQGEFRGRCRCGVVQYEGEASYVTNCTASAFARNSAAALLSQIPIETEVLIFTGNDIGALRRNAFGDDVTFERLRTIDLSRNNITAIDGRAFHRVPNVRSLNLSGNRWRVDAAANHTRLFANMAQLQELRLDNALDAATSTPVLLDVLAASAHALVKLFLRDNHLGPFIRMDAFCGLPSLADVDLSGNDVVQLLWDEPCLSRLHTLDLSRNRFRFLTNGTMQCLDAIGDVTVILSDNHFNCDCHLLPFYNWMHVTDVHLHDRELYVCADGFPESNAGAPIMSVAPDSLWCRAVAFPPAPSDSFTATHMFLVVLIVLLGAVLVAVALVGAVGGRAAVYRRIQYSSIQRDAEVQL